MLTKHVGLVWVGYIVITSVWQRFGRIALLDRVPLLLDRGSYSCNLVSSDLSHTQPSTTRLQLKNLDCGQDDLTDVLVLTM